MASGWARDGAVQDQIDASVEEALEQVRNRLNKGESAEFCVECDLPIPEVRRTAVPGVQHCISCQAELEATAGANSAINRRASKDSQLR